MPWGQLSLHAKTKTQHSQKKVTNLSLGICICIVYVYVYVYTRSDSVSGGSDGKASAYNVGDPGSIPGSRRSSGEGNGNPLQNSCLENLMDGGAW